MEEVKETIERMRKAEAERLAALLYVSWLPFVSLGMYLSMITESWVFMATLWGIGFVPYVWTAVSFQRAFGKRGWLTFAVWFAVGGTVAYLTKQGAWGVAIAIGGALFTSSLLDSYKSRWVDASSGLALVLLTLIGSLFADPWASFALSVLTVYSFAALFHLMYGVYEVIPYVVKRD